MKHIFDFINKNRDVAFATINTNGDAAIRVFQIMQIDELKHILFFATSPHKMVYNELKNHPVVELLAFNGNISVRIKGKTAFDVSETMAQKIYNENPILKRLYKDYSDLAYFSLKITKVDYFDLDPTPPLMESYCFE